MTLVHQVEIILFFCFLHFYINKDFLFASLHHITDIFTVDLWIEVSQLKTSKSWCQEGYLAIEYSLTKHQPTYDIREKLTWKWHVCVCTCVIPLTNIHCTKNLFFPTKISQYSQPLGYTLLNLLYCEITVYKSIKIVISTHTYAHTQTY